MVDKDSGFGLAAVKKEGSAICRYCYCEVKPWVGLTDAEIHNADGYAETRETYRLARAIEAKLKEKNGG